MATLDQDDLTAIRAIVDEALLYENSRVYDTFTDVNGTLLTAHDPEVDASRNGWIKEDGQNITIQNNAAVVSANDFGTPGTVYVIDTTEKSFRARIGFICPSIESQNFYFRYDRSNGSCYYIQTFPQGNVSRIRLRYFNGSTETTIIEKTINYAADTEQFIQIIVDGAEVRAFIEGVTGSEVSYQMDANLSATYFGIGGGNISTQVTTLTIKPSTSASSASDLSNAMAELTESVELLVTVPQEAIASNLDAIADAVSAEVLADTGIGTDTARMITVSTVDSSDDSAIAGARISVLTSGSVSTGQVKTTGSSGTAQVTLDDGTYKLRVTPPTGYVAPNDTSITVNSSATPVEIQLTPTVLPESDDPEKCLVRFGVRDGGATNLAGVTISAWPSNDAPTVDGAILANVAVQAVTDATGYAELELPRSAALTGCGSKRYRFAFTNSSGKVYREVEREIPDAAAAWFEDILNGTV